MSRIDQWQEGTRLDSWMYRIAQNINTDQARSLKSHGTAVDIEDAGALTGGDVRSVVESRSELAAARDAISSLPEDQRALMALIVMDGQSYREAADILGIPIGTVMSRLARARQAIDAHVHRHSR